MIASASTPPPGAVDNGDGTYSYVDPDSLQVGALEWVGPVLYSYVDQVRYSYAPQAPGPYVVSEPSGWRDHAPRAVIMSGERIDQHGRRWLPIDVDDASLLVEVQTWETDYGIDWPATTSLPTTDLEYVQGSSYTLEPYTWFQASCTSGLPRSPYRVWDTDDRTVASSFNPGTWREWERRAVLLEWNRAGVVEQRCHGSLVHPEWVLTAAHCVYDDSAQGPIDVRPTSTISLVVVTHGGDFMAAAVTRNATQVHLGPYRGNGWAQNDYALVKLDSPITHTGFFRLSGDSRNKIRDDFMIHSATFPAHSEVESVDGPATCTPNHGAMPVSPLVAGSARPGWQEQPVPDAVTRTTVRTKFTATHGESGSPWFRCHGATGSCEEGENAFQTSLLAVYNPVTARFTGPLVPRFRAWAITCIRSGAC